MVTVGLLLAALGLGAAAWSFSTDLRANITHFMDEVRTFQPQEEKRHEPENGYSIGEKSIGFVAAAPIVAGTAQARSATNFATRSPGKPGWRPWRPPQSTQPDLRCRHSAWVARHRGAVCDEARTPEGCSPWPEGFLASDRTGRSSRRASSVALFNSHLFDFTQGWGYVIGVGVAAGDDV